MQEYTSLETSRKIYEMFGWGSDTEKIWRYHKPNGASELKYRAEQEEDDYRFRNNREAPRYREENDFYPAYTLIYLLDKLQLPYQIESHKHQHNRKELGYDNYHIVCWPDTPGIDFINSDGSELVEAAALLCLELGKQGILPKVNK